MTRVGVRPTEDLAVLRTERDHVVGALIESQDRLAALGSLLSVPTETLDEDEVVARLLAEALELTASDAAWLVDADRERTALAPGVDPRTARDLRTRAEVPVPGTGGRLVLARAVGARFTTGDLRMVETVAAAVGTLVALTRVHRQEVRRATVDREHRLASELAQAALVTREPRVPGLEVFARCLPADLAGGDLVVHAVRGDVLWFAVGDVAGKGLPAAVTMTRAVSALQVAFQTHADDDPAGAVVAVAAALADYLDAVDLFVTVVVGTVRAGGLLHLCNAGHSPVLLRGPGGVPVPIPPTSPPLGLPLGRPRVVTRPFGSDALLVLGTDGLTEQEDPTGEQFGHERLAQLCAVPGRSAESVGAEVFSAVTAHADGRPFGDDRTLLIVRGSGA